MLLARVAFTDCAFVLYAVSHERFLVLSRRLASAEANISGACC